MSLKTEEKIRGSCIFCYKLLCETELLTVNDAIVKLLKFFIENIDPDALQTSSLCVGCLENINAACKFTASIKNLGDSIANEKIKDEFSCDEIFVICSICQNNVKRRLAVPLVDHTYMEDVNTFLLKQDIKKLDKSQICESCQISMLNLNNILGLLNNYSETHSVGTANEYEHKDRVIIKYEPVTVDIEIKEETYNPIETSVKEEVQEVKEDEGAIEDFQIKPEELDLKMDSEEESFSEGVWEHERIVEPQLNKAENNKKVEQDVINNYGCKSKTFKCLNCKYQTNHKSYLTAHMLVHKDITETKMFRCHQCEYQSKRKIALKYHTKVHQDKFIKCPQCEFQTKHKSYLKNHMIVHKDVTETEMFRCHQCEYQSKRKNTLNYHMKVHQDEFIKCPQCEFQSKCKTSLQRHMTTHRDVSEAEMFKCLYCKFQTKFESYLNSHMLVHKDKSEIFKYNPCEYKTKCYINRRTLVHKDVDEI